MSSDPITRLNTALEGRYSIERELGEGGMAKVYLADDLKHERQVALKVLKPELAAVVGAERFLAEIKTTANLQHPHILPLFDSGEADGFLFYVMPFVEGETLRDRIDSEKQLPVDEALGIATAVASALHAAHEQGVIHRDIKPANILLSRGEPVIADFGIALAVSAGGGGRLTETGLSLGTPYYMSPEQATGDQAVGPASDTFALACVLYEMLVGEPPYPGNTAQAVLGKIIQGFPVSATAIRQSVPPNVDAAIRKSLEKLPADRFTNAQHFAKALADPGFRHGDMAFAGVGGAAGSWNRLSMVTTTLAVVFALSTAWAFLRPDPPEPVRGVEVFGSPFQEGQEPVAQVDGVFDLSPDGSMLVYSLLNEVGIYLMVRRWDELEATQVRESRLASGAAVSPDGLELTFVQEGRVKVLSIAGGPVRDLLAGLWPEWGPDGSIYAQTESGIVRIPAAGGAVESVASLQDGDVNIRMSDVLPDGKGGLVMAVRESGPVVIRGLDIESGEMTPITEGSTPRYLPSGHLVFGTAQGTIMAARFDPRRMELLGQPMAIMDGVQAFTLSNDGKLFYSPGGPRGELGPTLQLEWVSRSGQSTPVDPDWTHAQGATAEIALSLSPGDSVVALREFTQGGYDIWLKKLDTGLRSRLTFDEAHEKMPVWNPDGLSVTYLSDRNGNFDVWSMAADGLGEPELIVDAEVDILGFGWSPDGEWLVLWTAEDDILGFRPGQDSEPVPLLAEGYDELDPAISADGRFIAYVSNETGENQVYVRPFPEVGAGRWQVSDLPARYPRWAHGGGELYFQDNGPSPSMWAVEVETTQTFRPGAPTLLFTSPGWTGSAQFAEPYEVAESDERFLIAAVAEGDGGGGPRWILVNNFVEMLRRVVPE